MGATGNVATARRLSGPRFITPPPLLFFISLLPFGACLHQFWENPARLSDAAAQKKCLAESDSALAMIECVPPPETPAPHPPEKISERTLSESRDEPDPESADPSVTHEVRYDCLEQKFRERANFQNVQVVSDSEFKTLWPGALIRGDSIDSGAVSAVNASRAPAVITLRDIYLDSPDASYSATLKNPDKQSVDDAIRALLAQSSRNTIPARIYYDSRRVRNFNQLKIGAAASVSIDLFILTASGRVGINALVSLDLNHLTVRFTQAYFTAVLETPAAPDAVFGDSVSADDLRGQITPDNPPAYVSQVTYGRTLTLVYSSVEPYARIELFASASYSFLGIKHTESWSDGLSYSVIFSNLGILSPDPRAYDTFRTALGQQTGTCSEGDAASCVNLPFILSLINDYLNGGNDISAGDYGVPVSYQMRWLVNNEPAVLSLAAGYKEKVCEPAP